MLWCGLVETHLLPSWCGFWKKSVNHFQIVSVERCRIKGKHKFHSRHTRLWRSIDFFGFCLVVYAWIVLTDIYVSSVDLHRWSPEFIHYRSIKPDIIPSFLGLKSFTRPSRFCICLCAYQRSVRTHASTRLFICRLRKPWINNTWTGVKYARSGWRCGRFLTVSSLFLWLTHDETP